MSRDEEERPPPGVRPVKSLREADKRIEVKKETEKSIEMQLADPNVTHKDGTRMTLKEWELWRSRALHALRRHQIEHAYLNRWLKEARIYIRAKEAGITNQLDPVAHLATSLRLMRSIRKCEALPQELHEKTGKVADAVEAFLTHTAEVA